MLQRRLIRRVHHLQAHSLSQLLQKRRPWQGLKALMVLLHPRQTTKVRTGSRYFCRIVVKSYLAILPCSTVVNVLLALCEALRV